MSKGNTIFILKVILIIKLISLKGVSWKGLIKYPIAFIEIFRTEKITFLTLIIKKFSILMSK